MSTEIGAGDAVCAAAAAPAPFASPSASMHAARATRERDADRNDDMPLFMRQSFNVEFVFNAL
jgi:hypothetical protein